MIEQHIRTVSALLVNRDGKLVAQLRDDKPEIPFPGHWSTLGGRVEPHETPDEAVRRELEEEIEISPPMTFWRVFENKFEVGEIAYTAEIHAYVGALDSEVADLVLHEGQRLGCFGADDIDGLPFAFGLERLYQEYFSTFERR